MLCEHGNTTPCVECDIGPLKAENESLRTMVEALVEALEQIRAIEDELYGGDWDEIEKARNIANESLDAHSKGGDKA